jgi:hypothetical protein
MTHCPESKTVRTFCMLLLTLLGTVAKAQNDSITQPKIAVEYTDKGFQFTTSDDRFQFTPRIPFSISICDSGGSKPPDTGRFGEQ